jgi:uncharacterized protein
MQKKEVIKELIVSFQKKDIITNQARDIAIPADTGKIIIVAGVRKSGKTTLFFQTIRNLQQKNIPKEQLIYINFEDERLSLNSSELYLIIESYQELYPEKSLRNCHIFFDEIHHIEGWEDFIQELYLKICHNIYLAGSDTSIFHICERAGLKEHTIQKTLYPLSFREYLLFNKYDDFQNSRSHLLRALEHVIKDGGFPELIVSDGENHRQILSRYFNTMIFRDIVERYSIPNAPILKFFVKKIWGNITNPLSVTKIYNELKAEGHKIGKNYLFDFLHYLESTFFLILVNKYDNNPEKQENAEKKAYVIDNGFLTATNFAISKDREKMLENFTALEFIKQGYKPLFYKKNKYCDFIIQKQDVYLAFQVCGMFEEPAIRKKELSGLLSVAEEIGINRAHVITYDLEDEISYKKLRISVIPAYKLHLYI